jgi:hypothetical protein
VTESIKFPIKSYLANGDFYPLVFFVMVNSGEVALLQSDKRISLADSVSQQKIDLPLLINTSATDVMISGRSIASIQDIISTQNNGIEAPLPAHRVLGKTVGHDVNLSLSYL